MKIGIMGAGLSGLACAITLEKNGLTPIIFERRSQVGDRFVNAEAFMPILSRPIPDEYEYLAEKHSIYLQPLSNIRKLMFFSENNHSELSGHLGYINSRGRDEESFENQLRRQVHSQIIYNSKYTYEELLQEFTHVIMATGDAAYASKIQDFRTDITITIKGATVEGQFDRHQVGVWLDHTLAPQGYAYLLPYSEKEASIALGFPENEANKSLDINYHWELFLQRLRHDYQQEMRITDTFEINNYIIGQCSHPRLGNTFFVGNCFGSLMPLVGFGQFASILTGVYAAYDLLGKGKYTELVGELQHSYANSLALRKVMEQMSNESFDKMVDFMGTAAAQKLFNSSLNTLKIAGYLLRPLVKGRDLMLNFKPR